MLSALAWRRQRSGGAAAAAGKPGKVRAAWRRGRVPQLLSSRLRQPQSWSPSAHVGFPGPMWARCQLCPTVSYAGACVSSAPRLATACVATIRNPAAVAQGSRMGRKVGHADSVNHTAVRRVVEENFIAIAHGQTIVHVGDRFKNDLKCPQVKCKLCTLAPFAPAQA